MTETEAGQLTHWNEPDPRPSSYRISLKTPLVNLCEFMSTYVIVSEYIELTVACLILFSLKIFQVMAC